MESWPRGLRRGPGKTKYLEIGTVSSNLTDSAKFNGHSIGLGRSQRNEWASRCNRDGPAQPCWFESNCVHHFYEGIAESGIRIVKVRND